MKSKRSVSSSSSFTKIINSWGHQSGLALKNVAGSYISYISYCIIQKKNGNHLFILPEKEQALYFLMIWKIFLVMKRGITYFLSCLLQKTLSNNELRSYKYSTKNRSDGFIR